MTARTTRYASYPAMGQLVDFLITDNQTGVVSSSQGRILAICMDGKKRAMAHIEYVPNPDNKPNVNIDLQCVNASDEFKAQLQSTVEQVLKGSAEANALVAGIVTEKNKQNDDLFNAILGEPITFDLLEGETDAPLKLVQSAA
jgi:hypothetical protein